MRTQSEVTIHGAQFYIAVPAGGAFPNSDPPEIALFGRSNVGKSSLINRILGRRGLAQISKTPGKTRTVNFYSVEVTVPPTQNHTSLFLVDFPGFGYARYSKQEREEFNRSTVEYIKGRVQLKVALLLVDPKRPLGDDERAIVALAFQRDLPCYLVATKMDRFGSNERRKILQKLYSAHGVESIESAKDSPIDPLWHKVAAHL